MPDYDVIICGAGTAGTTAAFAIAKGGFSVLLIDKKSKEKIGDKTCGDALASHHPETLKELIGLPDIPENIVEHRVDSMDLIAPDRHHRLRLDGPTIRGFSFDRLKLGQWLLSLAEGAGAELSASTRVKKLRLEGGKVTGVRIKRETEEEDRDLTARVVVDASGASGLLRRQLPANSPIDKIIEKEDMMVAWRDIYETPDFTFETPSILEVYWNQDQTPGGYTWVFPQGQHRVNIGLGLMTLPGHRGPREIFDSFVRENWYFMKKQLILVDSSGGIAPMRRPIDTMVDDNFMLVGDAACQVNPVHGGGIGPSMLGGALAGMTASDALESNDTSIKALWPYNSKYMERYGVKQAALDIFRWYLLTVTNDEIDFAFRKGIIKGADLLSVSITGEMKTPKGDKLRRLISGIGNIPLLRRMAEVSKIMAQMRVIYADYPDSPTHLQEWKDRLPLLYRAAKQIQ